jgi:CHAD domain-containing protein
LEQHATAAFQSKLQRIGRIIGTARDWDVFCLEALPKALGEIEELGWNGLLREAADVRRRAADAVSAGEIREAAFTALVLGLSAWIESGDEQMDLLGDEELNEPLSEVSTALLDRIADKVDKRSRDRSGNVRGEAASASQITEEAALQLGVSILALPSEGDAAISAAAEEFAEHPGNHKRRGRGPPPRG